MGSAPGSASSMLGRWVGRGGQMRAGMVALIFRQMNKNLKKSNPSGSADYYTLDPEHTDPARLKREREKARKLRKSQWWLDLVNRGICHYCGEKFSPGQLTMDHRIPLARGGTSTQGNLVPCCKACNNQKGLGTPVDDLFRQLEAERNSGDGSGAASDDEDKSG